MEDRITIGIGDALFGFQAALKQGGSSLKEYLEKYYYKKWVGDTLLAAVSIRATFVTAMHQFLTDEGLFNLERIQLSPVTDPLAHDVEHVPAISYKGLHYVLTHSMIYSKFLACFHPRIKGVFVDSPNIRLEVESPDRVQRGKYIIDFSQMDIEMRRNRGVDIETYLHKPDMVKEFLREDLSIAKDFFERMLIYSMEQIVKKNKDDLGELGVVIEIPKQPFPTFAYDQSKKKYGHKDYEAELGKETSSQLFWITGIPRENYDLVYPYLKPDGKTKLSDVTSDMVYNYDICAKSIIRDTGEQTEAKEILSGGIREWLFETIVERLLDNKVIPVRPIIEEGNIENINQLNGYGPFLLAASLKDGAGRPVFPDTYGGGLGIERTMYALFRGPRVEKIDDVTFFGKNPDSHQIYLF
ncbi:MAG TPA: amino acid--tRNA ligase-related protein [Desulfatiglandales bacterium]|nr:amino acid--tRNA ligase-related protein [Desulfatiglandales bacterium]